MNKVIFFLMIFPFVGFLPINTYVQPYYLIAICVYFLFNPKGFHINTSLAIFFGLTLLVAMFTPLDALRSVIGLLGFVLVSAWSNINSLLKSEYSKIIGYGLNIWIMISCVQMLWPEFGSALLPMWRDTSNRGVNGLAPEPSYLGSMGIAFYLLSLRYNVPLGKAKSIFLVVLSQSMFAFLLLFVLLFWKSNWKNRLYVLFISSMLVVLVNYDLLMVSPRVSYLTKQLLNNPIILASLDESVGDRVSHIILTFQQFFIHYSLPHGFNAFREAVLESELLKNLGLTWVTKGRIMSTIGALLFEMGFLSIPFFFFLYKKSRVSSMVKYCVFLYLFQFPLAFPLFPFLISKNNDE